MSTTKLKQAPITSDDIKEFAEKSSDFGFEQQILSKLIPFGFECNHGGIYDDPVTGKARQFDIRATFKSDLKRVRMAIECKNLRHNFPLTVFTVPRIEGESYHDFIYSYKSRYLPRDWIAFGDGAFGLSQKDEFSTRFRLGIDNNLYPLSEPVGKSCSQVGRKEKGDELIGNDAGAYEKWNQAVQSAHDLIQQARFECQFGENEELLTFVLPILVVPNERLWTLHYKPDGQQDGEPQTVNRACLYLDQIVKLENPPFQPIKLSHLEILTEDGLKEMCEQLSDGSYLEKVFPQEGLIKATAYP